MWQKLQRARKPERQRTASNLSFRASQTYGPHFLVFPRCHYRSNVSPHLLHLGRPSSLFSLRWLIIPSSCSVPAGKTSARTAKGIAPRALRVMRTRPTRLCRTWRRGTWLWWLHHAPVLQRVQRGKPASILLDENPTVASRKRW